jgi:hypothetical protein
MRCNMSEASHDAAGRQNNEVQPNCTRAYRTCTFEVRPFRSTRDWPARVRAGVATGDEYGQRPSDAAWIVLMATPFMQGNLRRRYVHGPACM